MASCSPRTHGTQRESPYDIIPRIILDTFNPDLPKRTVVCSYQRQSTSANDFQREGDFVPYGTFFVTVGVDMVTVIVISELAIGTLRKSLRRVYGLLYTTAIPD